jgi:hypothetical protein
MADQRTIEATIGQGPGMWRLRKVHRFQGPNNGQTAELIGRQVQQEFLPTQCVESLSEQHCKKGQQHFSENCCPAAALILEAHAALVVFRFP